MAIPKPTSPLEVAAVAAGALVGVVVVLPLLPLVLDLVVGAVRGVFEVVVPGGRTYE
ncbi:hypothetical protein [Halorussus halobius]|uniref:hypothetical protein n=1 Tax=Halorussus halobius TaxID=1710537 RepID=UPI00143D0999|nr:hypothetical protein [Halorussus halobius]